MYTNSAIRTHNKCLCLLQMIQEAGNRIERAKDLQRRYYNSGAFDMLRVMYKENWVTAQHSRWQRVHDRLVSYYETLKAQL